ncbi:MULTISPECIES: helix-turn-helix domain-containing protein [Shewanella]|uniref:XRE family transcriptional regulator n=1 Tax=Shewanella psychromarinicola TaxID=2487742 RepID=A0A3N4DYX9_9GAMM|nr:MULTISPECIES: helix-turn-helix transcriptional regulator [Shewanella]AZG35396.1 XRE family transcriptional regulator [Shewanella psychromarinicola]MBO1898663.1 helix-turn-helix transcriptional regulator [Shewanella sp. BF02_Schw]MCL1083578.1 helix-turn-helix transcriptional regulator [Shewanella psychromarinicola]RPA31129.1 XRE family transcriptional regulator [Shewanella psychromarinicola]
MTEKAKMLAQDNRHGRLPLAAKRQKLPSSVKDELMKSICIELMTSQITTGKALQRLRTEMLFANQEQYAKMVGITRKALSEIEGDKSKASALVLGKALRGVGLELLVLPRDKFLQGEIIGYKKRN